MKRILILFLLTASLRAAPLATPPGYFPRWIKVEDGKVTDHRLAPRLTNTADTPNADGYDWVIVKNDRTSSLSMGTSGNRRLETYSITVGETPYLSVRQVAGWEGTQFTLGQRWEMIRLYRRAYAVGMERQAILADDTLPSNIQTLLAADAAAEKAKFRAKAAAIRVLLYP